MIQETINEILLYDVAIQISCYPKVGYQIDFQGENVLQHIEGDNLSILLKRALHLIIQKRHQHE
jgi:hypothetical protein